MKPAHSRNLGELKKKLLREMCPSDALIRETLR